MASLSMLLKFPQGAYLDLPVSLRGKGLSSIADHPDYQAFFAWRDRIYSQFRKPLPGITPPVANAPTNINID
ncbi:MAG: glutathione S-transferase, partial [Dolichospermum sp.]